MSEDCFARMGVERRLCWTPEGLQEIYDLRCREAHPDSGGEHADFQEVQRAIAVLRSPAKRLRHWLESEGVVYDEGGALEEEVTGSFADLGELLRSAREAARRIAEGRSALAKSLAQRDALAMQEKLEEARSRLEALSERLCGRFEEFEREGARAAAASAGVTARSLMFLEKWTRQLREAWAGLVG
jgi:hypothetical protein